MGLQPLQGPPWAAWLPPPPGGAHTPSLLQPWALYEKMRNSTAPPLHHTSQ